MAYYHVTRVTFQPFCILVMSNSVNIDDEAENLTTYTL